MAFHFALTILKLTEHGLLLSALNSGKVAWTILNVEFDVNLAVHVGFPVIEAAGLEGGHIGHNL